MQSQVAHDMRDEIFETDWELFKEHYMDFFPTEEKLDTYLHAIAASHPDLLRATRSGYQFQGKFKFSNVGLHEDEFFEPLESIWKHTAEVVKNVTCNGDQRANPKICFKLVLKPTHRNDSSIDGTTHEMSGCFHSTAVQDEGCFSYHKSIPVCAEFKKTSQNPAEVVKNRRQLVTDANFNMNNDPRRMFTFGITIEGDDCSVWYFSRSHSAKSKSFQWKGAHLRQFIGTIIAFTFAEPEKLGFDPTITLIRKPTECYLYRIDEEVLEGDKLVRRSRFFKTEESISELHTTCITGRATRVWKAFEVNQDLTIINSQAVVLKDVWLDEDAQTERSIQKQIFDSVDAFKKKVHPNSPPPEFKTLTESFRKRVTNLLLDGDRYRKYFLTIITDSVGDPCKPALHAVGLSEPNPDLLHKGDPSPAVKSSATTAAPRMLTSKKRYRVVFEEVGSAIYCRASFSEVMKAMEGALVAIFVLFAAGWVHRDISTGNILWYKPSGEAGGASRGILSDLEYAKRYLPDAGSADPKMGTSYFMPTEVLRGFYSYQPEDSSDDDLSEDSSEESDSSEGSDSSDGNWSEDDLEQEATALNNLPLKKELPFKHNFLHDMESFFWVFLFIICTTLPKPKTGLVKTAQLLFFDPFGDVRCRSAREQIFIHYKPLYVKNKIIAFLDPSLSTVARPVTKMVMNLNRLYLGVPVRCEDYKPRISVIFKHAMKMIKRARKAKAPAICFKPLHELGKSKETQKRETVKAPAQLVPEDRLLKDKANGTPTLASQDRRSEKRKAVDYSVQNHISVAPLKRLRSSKEVEPGTNRALRSQSQKGSENPISQIKLRSSARSKPSGSRKPRAARGKH